MLNREAKKSQLAPDLQLRTAQCIPGYKTGKVSNWEGVKKNQKNWDEALLSLRWRVVSNKTLHVDLKLLNASTDRGSLKNAPKWFV